jgi:hypothetical protein
MPERRGATTLVALTVLLAMLLVVGLSASEAAAHGRSVSYSTWEIDGPRAVVTVRMKLLELSRLGPDFLPPEISADLRSSPSPRMPRSKLPRDLVLIADGAICQPDPLAERRPDERGWVRYRWSIECPDDASALAIRSRILLDAAPSHMHFARVRFAERPESVGEQVLTEGAPEFSLRVAGTSPGQDEAQANIGSGLIDYIELGIDHILTGWDHLAFVFGLLLLARRFGEVARLITGFTLAHSLTLALAVQGLVYPRATAVEAVIAFSVALVAIEKGWLLSGRNRLIPMAVLVGLGALGISAAVGWTLIPVLTVGGLLLFSACYFGLAANHDSEWLRGCLTFAFGLVHGFGFAGVLLEMTLPTERLVPALIGFNLGVEIGQVGVVLILWPLLALGGRLAPRATTRLAGELSAAAICGLGLYWLVARAFPV